MCFSDIMSQRRLRKRRRRGFGRLNGSSNVLQKHENEGEEV
jgi:hypothetical protein